MLSVGWRGRGVAQGAPISPLLANIYLHPIDRLTATLGYRMVRYADDFVILVGSSKEANRALKDIERLLRNRGLLLNRQKTRIVAPGEMMNFLGHTIVSRAVKPIAVSETNIPASAGNAPSVS